jgi:predicted transcriptional regulator of viral defense system
VPPGTSPENCPIDAFLVASRAQEGAVISYHSALEVHGLAYSTFEVFQYVGAKPGTPWTWRSLRFRPVTTPLALTRRQQPRWGVVEVDRQVLNLSVTDLERTFVDVLDRPDLGGGWEEIWRSLESLRFLDLERVLAYVRLLENASTAARVGFYLEQHQEAFRVKDSDLLALEGLRPKQVNYLVRSAGGRLAKRWNLIVPQAVWHWSWEES